MPGILRQRRKIRVISQKNQGHGPARYTGTLISTGKYICFIDSDDFLNPKFMDVLYKSISENNAEIAISGIVETRSNNKRFISRMAEQVIYLNSSYGKEIGELIRRYLIYPVWNKIFITDIIKDNKIGKDLGKPTFGEDILFVLEYLNHTKKIAITDKTYYNYKTNEDSYSKQYNKNRHTDTIYFFKEQFKFFESIGSVPK